jgi:hypothetical protein
MFSGGDSPNSRYGRTLGASSAMKSFQERNSSPSLSQRPGASPRTGLQRDGVRTGKSQLPTLRPTQDGRQSTPQTVRKDRLAVRPQAQMGEGSATSTGNASPGIASPLPRRLGSPLAGVRESSALMCAPSPTSRANLAQQPHSSSPAPSPLPQNRDAFGAVQAPKPVHHAARAKELIARDVNVTPVAPVNDSTLSNTSASSAARKVLPVKPREHNPQDSNQIDATSRKVKNVAVTKKSTAEMHDEMMKLFNEAKVFVFALLAFRDFASWCRRQNTCLALAQRLAMILSALLLLFAFELTLIVRKILQCCRRWPAGLLLYLLSSSAIGLCH